MLKLRRQNFTNFVPRNVPGYLTPKHVKDCQRTADHKIVSAQIIKSLLRDRYFEIGTLQDSPRMISTGKSLDSIPGKNCLMTRPRISVAVR